MPSTFFGLNIAASGLSAFQTSVNTTAHNISNVDTKGYSRQVANKVTMEAIRVNAKYGTAGTGVQVESITQIRDQYYDEKYWANQSKLGEYEMKYYYLEQMQEYFRDDGDDADAEVQGFSTVLDKMFSALDTLKTDGSSLTTRTAYISAATTIADFLNATASDLKLMQEDINQVIYTKVAAINSIAQKIASLNQQINILEQQGGAANELRDSRALLIDELSKIVPVETSETKVTNSNYPDMYTGATNFVVKINGQTLVSTFDYNQLECVPRSDAQRVNQSDIDGLYDIYWQGTNIEYVATSGSSSGELKALFDLRDGNNNAGFNGTLTQVKDYYRTDAGKMASVTTISDPSITDPAQVTMPASGTITLKNKAYTYNSYELVETVDANGKKNYSYQFYLDENMTSEDASRLVGKTASIGKSVDCMGIPYYQAQVTEFVRNFAKAYNDMILDNNGVDNYGDKAGVFFVADDLVSGGEYGYSAKHLAETTVNGDTATTVYKSDYYYFKLEAANFAVADEVIADPGKMATTTKEDYDNGIDSYGLVEKLLTMKDGVVVFRGGVASGFLQCLLSDVAVDTQKTAIFEKNYSNLADSITSQRMSVSGVDQDEEALELVKFQNAYNLASKMIQVMNEMYDRLITQTGV